LPEVVDLRKLQEVALWATILMNVEFDPHKSERCFESRGFDFEYVAHIFLDANRLIE